MEKIEFEDLGETLKKARQQKGLSRQDVAKILRKSYSSIESYEQGAREPQLQTVMDMFSLYGFRIRFLVENRNEQ